MTSVTTFAAARPGTRRSDGGTTGSRARTVQTTRPAPAAGPARTSEFRVADARRDTDSIRALYDRFVAERQRVGEGQAPGFESFRQLIAKQAERIRAEKGAAAVDFRLETRDGKVSLKARVVK